MSEQLGLFAEAIIKPEPSGAETDTEDCLPGLEQSNVLHMVFSQSRLKQVTDRAHSFDTWYRHDAAEDHSQLFFTHFKHDDDVRLGIVNIYLRPSGGFICNAEIQDAKDPDDSKCMLVAAGYENPFQVRQWLEELIISDVVEYVTDDPYKYA